MNRLTKSLAESAQKLAEASPDRETCGVFFFPQNHSDSPEFLALENRHEHPDFNALIFYDDLEDAILELYGAPLEGEFSVFHSHPAASRDPNPSYGDLQMALSFEKAMDGHPYWKPCAKHFVYALGPQTWWWHDFDVYGQVGWEFPE
jgi:proteasome lid subunit RPN8/RPN11